MKATVKMLQRALSTGSCRSPVRTAGDPETELMSVRIETDTDAQQYTERPCSKVSPRVLVFANHTGMPKNNDDPMYPKFYLG